MNLYTRVYFAFRRAWERGYNVGNVGNDVRYGGFPMHIARTPHPGQPDRKPWLSGLIPAVISLPWFSSRSSMSVDSRGIKRGRCMACGCAGYSGGDNGMKCITFGHPPGKHHNLSSLPSGSQASSTLGEHVSRTKTLCNTIYNEVGQ